MSVEFQTITFNISGATGSPYPESQETNSFSTPIQNAEACIKSWRINYSQGDRPFREASVKVSNVQITDSGDRVSVEVSAGIRDRSGDWDDAYDAEIEVLVIAVVSSI